MFEWSLPPLHQSDVFWPKNGTVVVPDTCRLERCTSSCPRLRFIAWFRLALLLLFILRVPSRQVAVQATMGYAALFLDNIFLADEAPQKYPITVGKSNGAVTVGIER